MALSSAQETTLATHIKASSNPAVVSALAQRRDDLLAEIYNADSAFVVWRSSVSPAEYREAIVWTEVDALQSGKARIWEWMTEQMTATITPASANVRQGIADAFASNTTTRANLLAAAKRAATLCESLFATGTGTSGTPGLLVYEGKLSITDVSLALNRNP